MIENMSSTNIVIIGAGGFGRETLMVVRDIARASSQELNFVGFMDDAQPVDGRIERLGERFLGAPSDEVALSKLPDGCTFSIAIGNGQVRGRIWADLTNRGLREALLVHPTAVIGDEVSIAGGVVCAGSIITTNVELGHSTQINLTCTIGHDVIFGDCVTLSPGVNISGNARVGAHSTIYSNAVVLPGVEIGEHATVGAGAVVSKNVSARTTVVGVPARPTQRI